MLQNKSCRTLSVTMSLSCVSNKNVVVKVTFPPHPPPHRQWFRPPFDAIHLNTSQYGSSLHWSSWLRFNLSRSNIVTCEMARPSIDVHHLFPFLILTPIGTGAIQTTYNRLEPFTPAGVHWVSKSIIVISLSCWYSYVTQMSRFDRANQGWKN
jgi:hypothetical protein